MSWAEVKKINSDISTPLNEKLDNMLENNLLYATQIFTSSGTFTAPSTGRYRIISVGKGGAGGDGEYDGNDKGHGGGGAGVGILIKTFNSGNSTAITIGTDASFGSYMTATHGISGGDEDGSVGAGGYVSGSGVVAYRGQSGSSINGGGTGIAFNLAIGGRSMGAGGAGGFGCLGGEGGDGMTSVGTVAAIPPKQPGLGGGRGGYTTSDFKRGAGGGGGGGFGGGGGGGSCGYSNGQSGIGGNGGDACIYIEFLG